MQQIGTTRDPYEGFDHPGLTMDNDITMCSIVWARPNGNEIEPSPHQDAVPRFGG